MEGSYSENIWLKSTFFNHIPIIVQDENEFTCSRLLEKIEQILATVRFEKYNVESINTDLDNELTGFNEISNELASQLDSLNNLSETHYCLNNNLKNFVEHISSLWSQLTREGYLQHYRIRIGSRTIKGFPLNKLMRKIQIDADEIKMMLQFSTCYCNRQCLQRGFYICEEISRVIESIANCDYKVQLLLAIPDITPRLIDLISSINNFVNNNEIIPFNRRSDELAIFPLVSKLLTGELLGNEPMDPEYVLITNAPKKPVFITKIMRRKVNNPPVLCEY